MTDRQEKKCGCQKWCIPTLFLQKFYGNKMFCILFIFWLKLFNISSTEGRKITATHSLPILLQITAALGRWSEREGQKWWTLHSHSPPSAPESVLCVGALIYTPPGNDLENLLWCCWIKSLASCTLPSPVSHFEE